MMNSVIVAALATSVVGGFEGLRQNAYPDPATKGHPWTICYGSTGADVTPGRRASLAECKALLAQDLDREAMIIEKCLPPSLPDSRSVAVLSLAFNIGGHGFCKSSIARKLNSGDIKGACDAFLLYNKAAGVVMPGLVKRRAKERELCLEGI
jgi:lysozyme